VVGFVLPGAGEAHRRNANLLLERHVLGPSPWRDWAAVLGAVLALVFALSLPIALVALALARFG
jgi:hypothetical protein